MDDDTYDGPEREPALFSQFDQFLKDRHLEQPIVVNELLELVQGILYRLRHRLAQRELANAIEQVLIHNEYHIDRNEWVLMDKEGNRMPLITPEMRESNPEMASMAQDLMDLATSDIDINPEDFM